MSISFDLRETLLSSVDADADGATPPQDNHNQISSLTRDRNEIAAMAGSAAMYHPPDNVSVSDNENENPINYHISQQPQSPSISIAQLTARLSNFSTSYNVVNISLVLPILEALSYHGTAENQAACASALLAGMILGQLLGGALGDWPWLGRLGALRLVMVWQIIASLGSATISSHNHQNNIYLLLAIWRFALGLSAGAVYPLAATLSAEEEQGTEQSRTTATTPTTVVVVSGGGSAAAAQGSDKTKPLKNVVLTFSMQGVGFLAVPLITVTLLYAISNLEVVWRLILGLGSIPGIILMLLQVKLYCQRKSPLQPVALTEPDETETERSGATVNGDNVTDEETEVPVPAGQDHNDDEELFLDEDGTNGIVDNTAGNTGIWAAVQNEPNLAQKLVGTAGTWFLFDVLFYGNTLFQPIVMEAAFGGIGGGGSNDDGDNHSKIKKVSIDSLILACIALPGYIVSAIVIGRRLWCIHQTPRYVQMQGFVVMALLYAIIGAFWGHLKCSPALLVCIYGLTFFFANYGPNTTTFVFPSLVYSPSCRSTLNGVSAAAGKLGALLGATLFEPASATLGNDVVMLTCAGVSVVAFALTQCFVRLPTPPTTTVAAPDA